MDHRGRALYRRFGPHTPAAYSLSWVHWIIGDIHGMLRPLEALLRTIDQRDAQAHLVFVGDYVNRGPDSRRVVDLLLTLKNATFLRGNHDDIFDLLLHGNCYICHPTGPDRVSAFGWFMQHGLDHTLISYGADLASLQWLAERGDSRKLEEYLRIVPTAHREFFRSLQPVFESKDFFVAHGYWDPDDRDDSPVIAAQLAADPRLRYQLLWGRFSQQQITGKKRWRRTGYFGHTPVFNYKIKADPFSPILADRIRLLDTAVALSVTGLLTAICPESRQIIQADRAGTIAGGS